jgi:hypothetical protein
MAAMVPASIPLCGESRLAADAWEKQNAHWLRRLALALVVAGVAWRLTRYLLRFPIWGDEAMLLVNYFTRGFTDLLGPIDNAQVAPLLFHWIERAVVGWLGTSELAVRLPAVVASLGALVLFWRLARLTLPPLARTLAVGILAVSVWTATMAPLAKPYAGDLFFALLLLTPAVSLLRQPSRPGPLVFLVAVIGPAVLASYPAVFVGGAVSLALLPTVWQRRSQDRKVMLLFALYNLLLAGTFAAHYLLVARSHLGSPVHGSTTAADMFQFWGNSFPPLQPLRFVKWLVMAHTCNAAAYPLGGDKGGSTLTLLLALVGLRHFYRGGQRRLLLLAAGSFGLTFLAALLRRYPYGAACRLAQHLAPFWCLLAGVGVAVLIQRLADARSRWKATLAVCGILAVIPLAAIVCDCVQPYRDLESLWARQVTDELLSRSSGEPVLVAQPPEDVSPLFHWQLRRQGEQVVWANDIDWARAGRDCSSLWVFSYGTPDHEELPRLRALLTDSGRGWRCVERIPRLLALGGGDGFRHCRLYHWVREGP